MTCKTHREKEPMTGQSRKCRRRGRYTYFMKVCAPELNVLDMFGLKKSAGLSPAIITQIRICITHIDINSAIFFMFHYYIMPYIITNCVLFHIPFMNLPAMTVANSEPCVAV